MLAISTNKTYPFCDRDSRQTAKKSSQSPSTNPQRNFNSDGTGNCPNPTLTMSSSNEGLSPAPPADSSNSTPSLPAKRKRDETLDGSGNTHGVSDSKLPGLPPQTAEASRAMIRDLIDVMKA